MEKKQCAEQRIFNENLLLYLYKIWKHKQCSQRQHDSLQGSRSRSSEFELCLTWLSSLTVELISKGRHASLKMLGKTRDLLTWVRVVSIPVATVWASRKVRH